MMNEQKIAIQNFQMNSHLGLFDVFCFALINLF